MAKYQFSHPIEIRYSDLDPQGHVNNAQFLSYFEQARINYLIHLGLYDPGESFLKVGIIIAEARITYLKPILFGMKVMVDTAIHKMGNKSMTMDYRLAGMDDEAELATGSTILVAYDYYSLSTIPIPENWRSIISKFEHLD